MHAWGDWTLVGCFDPYMEIEAVNYMFILVGFGLVHVRSVALVLNIESGASWTWCSQWYHMHESHWVALKSHLLSCDVLLWCVIYVIIGLIVTLVMFVIYVIIELFVTLMLLWWKLCYMWWLCELFYLDIIILVLVLVKPCCIDNYTKCDEFLECMHVIYIVYIIYISIMMWILTLLL